MLRRRGVRVEELMRLAGEARDVPVKLEVHAGIVGIGGELRQHDADLHPCWGLQSDLVVAIA
jgi:hypothetical protein